MSIAEKRRFRWRWPMAVGSVLLRGLSYPSLTPLTIRPHLEGSLSWILVAREFGGDGGIPAHFDLARNRWAASYPETTGYTIPTLLACARWLGRPELTEVAISLADYLLDARTPEGGVGHWHQAADQAQSPIVFDTGQVMIGWLAAWHAMQKSAYLDAAVAAAEWLVSVQSETGAWIRYQHLEYPKVIDARVAWALLQVAEATSCPECVDAARRCLEWVLSQQQPNGWFGHAAFQDGQDPFTHTIAYTAEGLLECGLVLDEPSYVEAARRVADLLLTRQRSDGSLASTYEAAWRPTSRSSCLTGNCQMALLWLRFYGLSQDVRYLEAASSAISFVSATQDLDASHPGIRGAIAGSSPIYGRYERFKYPNWAAKFYLDALLAFAETQGVGLHQLIQGENRSSVANRG